MKLKLTASLLLLMILVSLPVLAQDDAREFKVFNASNGMADNSAQTIVCTKTGRLVITTIGYINFYDGKVFSHIDPTREDYYQLSNYNGHYHAYFDRHHHLWLKNKHTVCCVNLTEERFVEDVDQLFYDMGMKETVNDLFVDDDGCVWLMHGNTITCMEHRHHFPVNVQQNLQDLVELNDTLLMLFYDNGEVVGFDTKTQKQRFAVKAYPDADVERYFRSCVLKVHEGRIYQARNGHKESILLMFDPADRQWTEIMRIPYKLNNLAISGDVLYIASEYGYWTYDLKTCETRHIRELTLEGGRKLLTDVNTIEFDRMGGMWLGTEKRGLLYAKQYATPFKVYDWSNPKAIEYERMMSNLPLPVTEYKGMTVNCVFTDSRGWTWVGTRTGLLLYTRPDGEPKRFVHRDGLLNEVIHSVIEDNQHNIWVSTSYGISCVIVSGADKIDIYSFNHTDYVPNETFIDGRAMKLADGTIVMQALDHVVAFDPSRFHTGSYKNWVLLPKLVKVMVNGIDITTGTEVDGKVILTKAVTRTKEIDVDYDQNSLTLTFSALNYFRPLQTIYRYRIRELGNQWKIVSFYNSGGIVDAAGLLHLPLIGLAPGEYHIEVQASMQKDYWPETAYEWILRVNEPWWRTTGVYLALGLVIVLLLVLNIVYYSRNVKMRLLRNSKEVDISKQIRELVSRCDGFNGDPIAPIRDEVYGEQLGAADEMDDRFVDAMLRVIPEINRQKSGRISMRDLSRVAGISVTDFYELMAANLNRSPHKLALRLRLQHATGLLRSTDQRIEDIADTCGFVSPNFFVASFVKQYRMTPKQYRETYG